MIIDSLRVPLSPVIASTGNDLLLLEGGVGDHDDV
jgi:hypothetical protein